MSSRKDPASAVVTYFETTSLEAATVVFNIAKGILTRRRGTPLRRVKKIKPAVPAPETTEAS
jgi:hypothetical protein